MNMCACSYMINVYVGVSCMRKKEGGRQTEKVAGGRGEGEEKEGGQQRRREKVRERISHSVVDSG